MRIACLQFAPVLGQVGPNIQRAEDILAEYSNDLKDLDLLVLPELAFSGYNFASLEEIKPFLERTAGGPTTAWASQTAARLNCVVVVGYPEDASTAPPHLQPGLEKTSSQTAAPARDTAFPVVPNTSPDFPHNYNSSIAVSPSGDVLAHYRKSFLYYTDATWAREGFGFWAGLLPLRRADAGASPSAQSNPEKPTAPPVQTNVRTVIGICMDLNPYNFTSSWDAFEFAKHTLAEDADVAVVNMAWLSQELLPEMVQGEEGSMPDTHTLAYWIERVSPVVLARDGKLRILVMGNRCGIEGNVCYAGTSAVVGVKDGEVWIWDMCGKGEERVCIADTDQPPKFALRVQKQHDKGEDDELEDSSTT